MTNDDGYTPATSSTVIAATAGTASKKRKTMNIEAEDVIRLMLQYCRDNNLPRTLMTLQEETGVVLNTIDSIEGFLDSVNNGRWDEVLKTCGCISLPEDIKTDLYEHVVFEFLEQEEYDTAQLLLEHAQPLKESLKRKHSNRYSRLTMMIKRESIDRGALYDGKSKKERRGQIAQSLVPFVRVAPPNRILTLLGQSIKWQKHQGIIKENENIDFFRGIDRSLLKAAEIAGTNLTDAMSTVDVHPKTLHKKIKVSAMVGSCAYSCDGQYFAIGGTDGVVELYDGRSGKLRVDLSYQSGNSPNLIGVNSGISCLRFSNNNLFIALGQTDGILTVWNTLTGERVVESQSQSDKIRPHEKAILSIQFNHTDGQILTGSSDNTAAISTLTAFRTLKVFKGHNSFVQTAVYSTDQTKVITGSADAYIKVFDIKTCNLINSFHPPTPSYYSGSGHTGQLLSINQIVLAPSDKTMISSNSTMHDTIYVSTECNQIYRMNLQGQVLSTFQTGQANPNEDFRCITVSNTGKYVYGVTKGQCLYIFDNTDAKLVHIVPDLAERDTIGVACHPVRHGYMAVWGMDTSVGLMRP